MCLHKWMKWSRLVEAYDGHKMQFRACSKCGKVSSRNLGYCHGVSPVAANTALDETGFTAESLDQPPTNGADRAEP